MPHTTPATASGTRRHRTSDAALHVNVVGGGLAGLAAALALVDAGHTVDVFEASARLGGRVRTVWHGSMPIEAGAEFVAGRHSRWHAHACRFGLELAPVATALELPLMYRGQPLPTAASDALRGDVARALAGLLPMADGIDLAAPWDAVGAPTLDGKSVASWVDAVMPSPSRTREALVGYLEGLNAVPVDCQSLLGHLVQVASDGAGDANADSFGARCAAGNDALPRALAASVAASGRGSVHLRAPVAGVETTTARVTLAGGQRQDADAVILAVPPSTWGGIALDCTWPHATAPQMGRAAKLVVSFAAPVATPAHMTEHFAPHGVIWESWGVPAAAPAAGMGAVIGFFPAHPYCSARGAALESMARALALPGTAATVQLYDWQREPLALGGYPFPAPGEVTSWGPTLAGALGRLHFAGDFTDYAYVGYMEGAIRSGEAAARRVMARG